VAVPVETRVRNTFGALSACKSRDRGNGVSVSTCFERLKIGREAASLNQLVRFDPKSAGASRYSTLCVGCHLAPGVAKSALRPGLYPHAPNLAQEDLRDARRAFWTIKHGIKMSAMPAWGKSLDDATIWEVVAFVRQMPAMSPETYQLLS
jgi:mono/diheme cytochrome c family protein